MYRYEKRKSKAKPVIGIILLMMIVSAISIYLYDMYININVKSEGKSNSNTGNAIRLSAESDDSSEISNTLEDTTKCVVGISKIKNKGDSIFDMHATENLSLGTGTIISDNGYIVTNWHLAGNKYSSCYVTLENGKINNNVNINNNFFIFTISLH